MTNTLFTDREHLLSHLITPLPLSRSKGEKLFADFQESGYVARQEDTGLSISPRLWGGNMAGAMTEMSEDAPGRVPVVMTSHPSFSDDEFDNWVEVVRGWVAALPSQTRAAYSREIKLMKEVDHGIPLNSLHKDMPAALLFSYRRPGGYVIIVEPPAPASRRIYTTRNIG